MYRGGICRGGSRYYFNDNDNNDNDNDNNDNELNVIDDVNWIYDDETMAEFKKYNIDITKKYNDYKKYNNSIAGKFKHRKLIINDNDIYYTSTDVKNKYFIEIWKDKPLSIYKYKLNQYLSSTYTIAIYYNKKYIDENNDYINLDKFPSKLKKFVCKGCNILALPDLPSSIITIYAQYNRIINIDKLPSQLNDINVNNNNIIDNLIIPKMVSICYANNNKYSSIDRIPLGIRKFDISHNNISDIKKIPKKIPSNICIFNCSYNKLTNIPDFSNCHLLENINLSHNNILKIDNIIPNSIEFLMCNNNVLIELPKIPRDRFRKQFNTRQYYNHKKNNMINLLESQICVNCSHNNIIELDGESASNITHLDCSFNKITEIPNNLEFEYNNIPLVRCSNGKYYHEIYICPVSNEKIDVKYEKYSNNSNNSNNAKLFKLNISNNPIKYINYEMLRKLKYIYIKSTEQDFNYYPSQIISNVFYNLLCTKYKHKRINLDNTTVFNNNTYTLTNLPNVSNNVSNNVIIDDNLDNENVKSLYDIFFEDINIDGYCPSIFKDF